MPSRVSSASEIFRMEEVHLGFRLLADTLFAPKRMS